MLFKLKRTFIETLVGKFMYYKLNNSFLTYKLYYYNKSF